MTGQVTRALLERYLRASGWARGERGWWRRQGFRQIGTFDGMSPVEVNYQVRRLAEAERRTPADLAFRLGRCASAEDLLAKCAVLREDGASESAMRVGFRVAAAEFFRDAGVTIEAWQAGEP